MTARVHPMPWQKATWLGAVLQDFGLHLLFVAFVALVSVADKPLMAQDRVTAFVHVFVVPMDRQRIVADQTVLVRGRHIIAMGDARKIKVPIGAQRVGGRGKFLMPGLADMHAHAAGLAFWKHEGDTMSLRRAQNALVRYVASGVTTIREMWGSPVMLAVKSQVASGAIVGPRIYVSVRPGREGLDSLSSRPAEAVRLAKQAGFDFIKFEIMPQGDELDSIVSVARQVGLPIAGHPPGDWHAEDNLLAIKIGYVSVEHLLGLWHSNADEARLHATAMALKQSGVWVCPTLAHISATFATKEHQSDTTTLYHAIKVLHDVGVGLLAGTDAMFEGPYPAPGGYSVADELAALVAAGLPTYDALATATRNPALYFGSSDSVGTVTVGKRADLVLLSGNPLTDIRQVARQAGVMVGGRWLPRQELDRMVAQLPEHPLAHLKVR